MTRSPRMLVAAILAAPSVALATTLYLPPEIETALSIAFYVAPMIGLVAAGWLAYDQISTAYKDGGSGLGVGNTFGCLVLCTVVFLSTVLFVYGFFFLIGSAFTDAP